MEKYQPGIGIAAGMLMLKWDLLNEHLQEITFKPDEIVNIFINFEGILKNLTTIKQFNVMSMFHKQSVVLELEAAILNMVSHYKAYFKREQCEPKIYLYYTDLTVDDQLMNTYSKFYRSYYRNHYLVNPAFKSIGDLMVNYIIPEIELILSYVPNCYFVKSKGFDGSLLPQVISTLVPSEHNIIFTTDLFDTLYFFKEDFSTVLIKRRYNNFKVLSTPNAVIGSMIVSEPITDLQIFTSEMYYKLLVAVNGSQIRNIPTIRGFGYGKLVNIIHEGYDRGVILKNFSSVNSILELFPLKYRDDLKRAMECVNLDNQLALLGKSDYSAIELQLVDNSDMTSLESLNNQRFIEFPINLVGLLS